jgi:hypothetical protein
VTVVAESPDDRSVVFRSYCSQMPITGRHEVRGPVLEPGPDRERGRDGLLAAAASTTTSKRPSGATETQVTLTEEEMGAPVRSK